VRRLATAVPAVLATVLAVLTLSTAPAFAHDGGRDGGTSSRAAHGEHGEHGEHGDHGEHAKKKLKPLVTFTGVVADTATATIALPSDTATSTIRIAVKGGERTLHHRLVVLTVDKSTVVRRGGRPVPVAGLAPGDRVAVRARRMPDGSWLALRINVAGRHDRGERD
jgi:hypothetical protein